MSLSISKHIVVGGGVYPIRLDRTGVTWSGWMSCSDMFFSDQCASDKGVVMVTPLPTLLSLTTFSVHKHHFAAKRVWRLEVAFHDVILT